MPFGIFYFNFKNIVSCLGNIKAFLNPGMIPEIFLHNVLLHYVGI